MKHLFIAFLCLVILSSCSSLTKVEYVYRDVIKTEIKYETKHDSVFVHDSVYHTVIQKGDTVYDTKVIEKTKYKEMIKYRDSIAVKDSVVYIDKVKTIEKKTIPSWCYFFIFLSILLIVGLFYTANKKY